MKGMLRRRTRLAFAIWVGLYVALAVLPLAFAFISLDPGRGFWINFSVALGFVGLALFGLQFVIAARSAFIVHPVGMDVVLGHHRQMAYVATLFVFAHPIILFVFDPRFLGLLDVFTSPLRAKFAVLSWAALLVLIVLSVLRQRLRVTYAAWQVSHAILALLVVTSALAHVVLVGYYVREWWEQALWIAYSVAFIAVGVWVRIVKPLQRRRRRWSVENVEHGTRDTTTVTIRLEDPRSYGGHGFRFEPGQFTWLQARRSAFAMNYHPFSFASSAERPDTVRFTIKAHDHFSRDVLDLRPGESIYLDGPFGAFVLPDAPSLVLIAAGVGVTPLVSMLETLADRGDTRPVQLWFGNRDEDSIPCHDEIAALVPRLNLEVTHVLSRPSGAWTGERGHVDAEYVRARVPSVPPGTVFCLCGPDAMMDDLEHALASAGVAGDAIRSERFAMV
ncbi:ferredoxin reductase family protein [Microbacterium aoyamense]|nr:ferric reductase-like transmembrane domain-containing protein [Microbacterium aoyamense]